MKYLALFIGISLAFSVLAQKRPNELTKAQWKSFLQQGTEQKIDCNNKQRKSLAEAAKKYLGTPHCMGGYSKKCIDCSGLVKKAFESCGCPLPVRTAEDIARYGQFQFNYAKLKAGDLVFFAGTYKTSRAITHAGIVVEPGKFIHASKSKGVMISSLTDGYWQDHFVFGTQ